MIRFDQDLTTGLGRILYEARAAQGLSLEVLSARTRIPEASLRALEHENWSSLPAPIYAKGFLRVYAAELGLDADDIVTTWVRECAAQGQQEVPNVLLISAPESPRRLNATVGILTGVAVGAVVLMFWLLGAMETSTPVTNAGAGDMGYSSGESDGRTPVINPDELAIP
jgi:cytoskeletal protein RodZ